MKSVSRTSREVKENILKDIKMELMAHKLGSIEVLFFEGLISLKLDDLESAAREEIVKYIAENVWYESKSAEDRLKHVLDSLTYSPVESVSEKTPSTGGECSCGGAPKGYPLAKHAINCSKQEGENSSEQVGLGNARNNLTKEVRTQWEKNMEDDK